MEDEEDVPDRETCVQRISEFVNITASNEAVAQQFLQEAQWKLELAVPAFFDALARETAQNAPDSDALVVEALFGEGMTLTSVPPPRLKLLSWNVDALDERCLKRRMAAVVSLVLEIEPDVIFLQEVVNEVAEYLERKLPEYKAVRGNQEGYYTLTLLRVLTVKYDSHTVQEFPGSRMGRHVVICRAHVGDRRLALLNTHLESGKEFGGERQAQLRSCFTTADSFPPEVSVILGGDLNLRDAEAAAAVPPRYVDAWEACGSRPDTRWTWDTRRNSNRGIGGGPGGQFGPRARFDRVYVRAEPGRVMLREFGVVGAQRAPKTTMFPSDHWGVFVCFDLRH